MRLFIIRFFKEKNFFQNKNHSTNLKMEGIEKQEISEHREGKIILEKFKRQYF